MKNAKISRSHRIGMVGMVILAAVCAQVSLLMETGEYAGTKSPIADMWVPTNETILVADHLGRFVNRLAALLGSLFF